MPICVDTRDKNTFFNPKERSGNRLRGLVFDKSVSEWQQFTIKLAYNATNQVPTHIVLVCSASRYGDYYIGSRDESKMWVDDFELVYDE
ncbi:MAG: PCMD domain-containing protein [Alistipes indistinctus]